MSVSRQPGRAKVAVLVRASSAALALFGEILGDAARAAIDAAPPPDGQGCREVMLSFEHEAAAAHRLAGFGGELEVLSPASVRARLIETALHILERYQPSEVDISCKCGLMLGVAGKFVYTRVQAGRVRA